jgi:hypothetical protein
MTVYELRFDVNHFKSLLVDEKNTWKIPAFEFDGKPKLSAWKPPKMYCDRPNLKTPDFWSPATSAAIAAGSKALPFVQTMFEMAGELLPLPYENGEETLTLLHILEYLNCLDHDKCEWRTTAAEKRLYPTRYVFHPNRFGESTLFRIPENRALAFCYERESDPETEFKAAVEHAKLTGLEFVAIWTDKKRRK